MTKIYEYLIRSFENITLPVRILWSYLTDFFYKGNPLTNEDKLNLTKRLSNSLTSNFDISYIPTGMILTKKRNNSGLITILDN